MKQIILLGFIVIFLRVTDLSAQSVEKYHEKQTITTTPATKADNLKNYYVNYQSQLQDEFDGSYQIIISNDAQIIISTETIDLINKNRSKNNEVILNLMDGINIKILSEKQIKLKKLIPLKELFIIQ